MLRPAWNLIKFPLFQWVPSLERIICSYDLPQLSGPVIYVTSDYSGQHASSNYQVISALYTDLKQSHEWEVRRRGVRREYLGDGRRISFKGMNDRQKQRALVPFLEAANQISGISVTLAVRKSISNLCLDRDELSVASESFGLTGKWKLNALETSLRIAHLVAMLVPGLSKPGQGIYWISDEDELFANTKRTEDLQKILGKFSGHYVSHQLGNLGMGTTAIDEQDRLEEDLTAVPDLIAGAVSEVTTRVAQISGGKISAKLAVPFTGSFSPKTNLISSWIWDEDSRLKKIVVLFEKHGKHGYVVSKFNMGN